MRSGMMGLSGKHKMKQTTLFAEADREFIKKLETKAIDFIRENEPKEGYYLGFSGGKDSVVIENLAQKADIKFKSYYVSTGIDPPQLTRFIRKSYPHVKWLFPEKNFFELLASQHGYPTGISRWCCKHLKKKPGDKIKLRHKIFGIRKEESRQRALYKPVSIDYKKNKIYYYPILEWSESVLWQYIEAENIPYCKLYDMGFHRMGCVVCPFICRKDRILVDKHMKMWPNYYKRFEKAMRIRWETKIKFKPQLNVISFRDFLEHWYRGKAIMEKKKTGKTEKTGNGFLKDKTGK